MTIKVHAIKKTNNNSRYTGNITNTQSLKKLLSPRNILLIGVIMFLFFAISDMFSVKGIEGGIAAPKQINLPETPLVSYAEEGLIGSEQQKIVKHVVKKGQTMSGIFTQIGLTQALLLSIVNSEQDGKHLTKVMPGTELEFVLDAQNELKQLSFDISQQQRLTIDSGEQGISSTLSDHQLQTRLVTTQGTIQNSLFGAGKKAGLSDKMVMQLAGIFSWDIDFVLEIRKGDSFSVIYQKLYKNGEYLSDGKILAAVFTNQGKTYRAVYFEDSDEQGAYYTPEGRSMKKAFLRAPLNFSYISSNFNPRRMHPVLKRVKPHNGIDYAAPTGTPVYAAGDGKVTKAGYNKYNGNYVFIKHPSGIVTKYLHLHKRMVKRGKRVKQGQTIGQVGSTGMSTGPHLHYEFVYKGVHRNPRTVPLPKAQPLNKKLMPQFSQQAKPLLAQLDGLQQSHIAVME